MKIQDLLKQARPCWKYAATDENGEIYFYSAKPRICDNFWACVDENDSAIRIDDVFTEDELFDIEPFEGNWKDSLIERKRNDGKLI